MGIKDKEIIQRFLEKPINKYDFDWNVAMASRDKISKIIGYTGLNIAGHITIHWWYSTKKTSFEWNQPRKPFDSVGGKYHNLVGYNLTKSTNQLEQTFKVIVAWIKWYNKTVKSNEKTKTKTTNDSNNTKTTKSISSKARRSSSWTCSYGSY
jgi:hypothetical protein